MKSLERTRVTKLYIAKGYKGRIKFKIEPGDVVGSFQDSIKKLVPNPEKILFGYSFAHVYFPSGTGNFSFMFSAPLTKYLCTTKGDGGYFYLHVADSFEFHRAADGG